jgi:hypothetical protein
VVFVLVLKVNQSDNLYQATRVSVMYNVYISGEMLVLMLFCLKKGTAVFNDTSVFFLSFHYFKVLYFNYNYKDSVE